MSEQYKPRGEHVEAEKVTPLTVERITLWCGAERLPGDEIMLLIPTLHSEHVVAEVGDYIVKDGRGRFDVFPGETFEGRYIKANQVSPRGGYRDPGGLIGSGAMANPSLRLPKIVIDGNVIGNVV